MLEEIHLINLIYLHVDYLKFNIITIYVYQIQFL